MVANKLYGYPPSTITGSLEELIKSAPYLAFSSDAAKVWDRIMDAGLMTPEIEQAIRRLSDAQIATTVHLFIVERRAREAFFEDALITG